MQSGWRSFWKGAARIFNIFGTTQRPVFLDRTDAEALAEDWRMIGMDMREAMRQERRRVLDKAMAQYLRGEITHDQLNAMRKLYPPPR
jgi:hypothetical protein